MIVTVYGSTTCIDSAKLRSWLDKKGVDYTGLLIDKNPHAASRLTLYKEESNVPFTTIESDDGNIFTVAGYSPGEIEAVIRQSTKS